MVQDRQIEKQEQSSVKLTMTVPAAEVRKAYDELVTKHGKDAQLKGFRKGKVPKNILERKFGESFRAETLQNVIETALEESITEVEEASRPLPYARPTLLDESLELDPDSDLTFSVAYDVFPEVKLGTYKGLEIQEPQVKITKKDENRELDEMREQNALVIEKEDGTVAEGDIVTMNFEEVDDNDEPVDGTRREDFTFTVGSGHNLYHLDTEVIGMATDETKVFEKEYADDFEHEELAGTKKRIRVEVTGIKERDVPELDDEFAHDISDDFETLEDLRKDVRSRLEKNAENRVRAKKIDQLMEQVVAASEVEVPVSMTETEMENSWRNLAQQYQVTPEQLEQLLAMEGKDRHAIFEEWRPSAVERLKRSLLVQKMIESEEIKVTEEDAEEQIRSEAQERKADPEQILEYYRKNGMIDYVQQEIAERRMFDTVLKSCTIKKGDKVEYLDLIRGNE